MLFVLLPINSQNLRKSGWSPRGYGPCDWVVLSLRIPWLFVEVGEKLFSTLLKLG